MGEPSRRLGRSPEGMLKSRKKMADARGAVLELLASNPDGLTFSEIVEKLKDRFSRQTVSKALASLEGGRDIAYKRQRDRKRRAIYYTTRSQPRDFSWDEINARRLGKNAMLSAERELLVVAEALKMATWEAALDFYLREMDDYARSTGAWALSNLWEHRGRAASAGSQKMIEDTIDLLIETAKEKKLDAQALVAYREMWRRAGEKEHGT